MQLGKLGPRQPDQSLSNKTDRFAPQTNQSVTSGAQNADKRIEAENAFAALTLPPNTVPNVAAAWKGDREARIRLNKPLIDHARAAAEAEEGA
jgi:hypothetical protein